MRAIKINSENQRVEVVEYDGDYKQIYALLSDVDGVQVRNFEIIRDAMPDGRKAHSTDLFIDGEFVGADYANGFRYITPHGAVYYVYGNGLIMDVNLHDGETVGTKCKLEDVQKRVKFMDTADIDLERAQRVQPELSEVKNIFGDDFDFIIQI